MKKLMLISVCVLGLAIAGNAMVSEQAKAPKAGTKTSTTTKKATKPAATKTVKAAKTTKAAK